MLPTIILSAVLLILLVCAVRYLWKNGTCAGCSQKGACHTTSQAQGCSGGCAHCRHCHTSSSTLK